MTYAFGDCELDTGLRELRRSGATRAIEPQVFEFLVSLIENRNRMVGKEELNAEIWGGRAVSDSSLSNCVKLARQAVGDTGKAQAIIRTVQRRGFRFVAPVDHRPSVLVGADRPQPVDWSPHPSERPGVAVLAFDNISGDPAQGYFADGIAEDIISSLSKLSQILVIARNSSFVYKGQAVNVQQITDDLQVRYLVEGSVRRSGDLVRVTAQLIDCATGGHIWGGQFDRELTELFEIQDEITGEIASSMAIKLTLTNQDYLIAKRSNSIEAYDLFLRRMHKLWMRSRHEVFEAKSLFQRATDIDPEFAAAYSQLVACHVMEYINQWHAESGLSLATAYDLSQRAVALDDTNPQAHLALGNTYLWKKRHDRAIECLNRTIALAPNASNALVLFGCVLNYAGRSDEAIGWIERGLRLDPHYADIHLHWTAQVYFQLGDYRQAADLLESRIHRNPATDISRILLAACYGHLGQFTKARAMWNAAHQINPDYSLDHRRQILPYKNPSDFETIADGLRKAGLRV